MKFWDDAGSIPNTTQIRVKHPNRDVADVSNYICEQKISASLLNRLTAQSRNWRTITATLGSAKLLSKLTLPTFL